MNFMNINGLAIKFDGDRLTIEGLKKGSAKSESVKIDKDGNISGDITGDVQVTGHNVILNIEGDVTGNIIGAHEVKVHGDVTGNISAEKVSRG
jgi:cytoskeletal protein CcmA (bactofilin family)